VPQLAFCDYVLVSCRALTLRVLFVVRFRCRDGALLPRHSLRLPFLLFFIQLFIVLGFVRRSSSILPSCVILPRCCLLFFSCAYHMIYFYGEGRKKRCASGFCSTLFCISFYYAIPHLPYHCHYPACLLWVIHIPVPPCSSVLIGSFLLFHLPGSVLLAALPVAARLRYIIVERFGCCRYCTTITCIMPVFYSYARLGLHYPCLLRCTCSDGPCWLYTGTPSACRPATAATPITRTFLFG
jgi:hypothetical protein